MEKKILATLLCLGLTATANANQDTTSSALTFSREETEMVPQGLVPFLAIGGGYTGYENSAFAEGMPASLKLLGSFYFPAPAVIDLGYGVNNQQFSQSTGTNRDTAITDGTAEVAARYRWDSRWQAGVVANHLFNQGVVYSADQADAQFVGLQVLKEFNMSASWLARVGARAQALTNNTDGNVTMYMIDLQLGWNPGAYKPSVRQTSFNEPVTNYSDMDNEEVMPATETIRPAARPVAMTAPKSALADINYAAVAGGSVIHFPTAGTNLTAQDQRKLTQLAQVLSENESLYDRVEVRGYADNTGSEDINRRISQQRANTVSSILKRNGVSDVVASGKGSLDSSGSTYQDRRAELVFIGVKDQQKLQEALSKIE